MRYLRRGVWYVAGRLFLICLILGISITVFYYAMNLSNIQIILKDGMAARAKTVMGMETDPEILYRYFHRAEPATDEMLQLALAGNSDYAAYNVRGIDHRLEMGFLWIWPWENAARLTIEERIPRIDGRVKGTRADEMIAQKGSGAVYPPAWPDARYRVSLVRENGQWKIRELTRLGAQ